MEQIVKYNNNYLFGFTHHKTESCILDIHMHDNYEIFQAISNNIRYFVEGNYYDLNSGDIIITNNKEIHRPTTTDANIYERRFIQFNPSLYMSHHDIPYNPLQFFTNRKPGTYNHFALVNDALDVNNQYFKSIESCFLLNTPKSIYEGRLILNQMLIELNTLHKSITRSSNNRSIIDPRIVKVLQHIDEHYQEAFNLDDFSKYHHMDKYYLSHLFKENTGFTLVEYIQSKRIQQAKTLLDHDLSLNEISLMCGFNDYSNFYKTFKKLVNCSPKDYKKSVI